tara:strand:- start:46 stop:330 length:285 start_codon:yes stop_codon:yes gene_type:complete
MEDFVIDIQINVHDADIEGTQIKTLTASILEDQTLIMVMEDVAKHLNYEKLELIHVALQELQQEFNIPDNNLHLEDAFKFTEDLREKYLTKEKS